MGMMPVTHMPGCVRYIFGLPVSASDCEDCDLCDCDGGGVAVRFLLEERREALRGVRSSQLAERPGEGGLDDVEKKDFV